MRAGTSCERNAPPLFVTPTGCDLPGSRAARGEGGMGLAALESNA